MTNKSNDIFERMSGFNDNENPASMQEFSGPGLGQNYPHHYPQASDVLGEPLSIREVAGVIGCSEWTVRHRYLPRGIPHLRSGPMGKLIFFRNQVVAWILQQQRKGGK